MTASPLTPLTHFADYLSGITSSVSVLVCIICYLYHIANRHVFKTKHWIILNLTITELARCLFHFWALYADSQIQMMDQQWPDAQTDPVEFDVFFEEYHMTSHLRIIAEHGTEASTSLVMAFGLLLLWTRCQDKSKRCEAHLDTGSVCVTLLIYILLLAWHATTYLMLNVFASNMMHQEIWWISDVIFGIGIIVQSCFFVCSVACIVTGESVHVSLMQQSVAMCYTASSLLNIAYAVIWLLGIGFGVFSSFAFVKTANICIVVCHGVLAIAYVLNVLLS